MRSKFQSSEFIGHEESVIFIFDESCKIIISSHFSLGIIGVHFVVTPLLSFFSSFVFSPGKKFL